METLYVRIIQHRQTFDVYMFSNPMDIGTQRSNHRFMLTNGTWGEWVKEEEEDGGRENNAREASASLWLPEPDGFQLQDNKRNLRAVNLTLCDSTIN